MTKPENQLHRTSTERTGGSTDQGNTAPILVRMSSLGIESKSAVRVANQILEGLLPISPHPPVKLTRPIDWEQDPYEDRSWRYKLHSWDVVFSLCFAFECTGKVEYFDEAVSLVVDWVQAHQTPQGVFCGEWGEYDMAAGKRAAALAFIGSWMNRKGDSEHAARDLIFDAAQLHLDWLRIADNINWVSNHGMYQLAGLLALASQMPWLNNSSPARSFALDGLQRCYSEHFTKDGVHREHSPSYQALTLMLLCMLEEAELIPPESEVASILSSSLLKLSWMVHPDGSLAALGDSGGGGERVKSILADRSPALTWATSGGRAGQVADSRVHYSSAGGIAIARDELFSTHPFKSSYLIMQAAFHGPRTQHKHADDGTFEWSVEGHRIIVDAGKFSYDYDHPMRRYCEAATSHNTMALDDDAFRFTGNSGQPDSAVFATETSDGFAISATMMRPLNKRLRKTAMHHRRLLIGNVACGMLVLDRVEGPTDARKVTQWLHFHPDIAMQSAGVGAVGSLKKIHLATIPILPLGRTHSVIRGQKEPALQGWHSPRNNVAIPNDAMGLAGHVSDRWFASLLLAGRRASPTATVRVVNESMQLNLVDDTEERIIATGPLPESTGVRVQRASETLLDIAPGSDDWYCDVLIQVDGTGPHDDRCVRLLRWDNLEVVLRDGVAVVTNDDGEQAELPVTNELVAMRLHRTKNGQLQVRSSDDVIVQCIPWKHESPRRVIVGDQHKQFCWSGRVHCILWRSGAPAKPMSGTHEATLSPTDRLHVTGLLTPDVIADWHQSLSTPADIVPRSACTQTDNETPQSRRQFLWSYFNRAPDTPRRMTRQSDLILDGKLRFGGRPEVLMSDPIDWSIDPFFDAGWCYELHSWAIQIVLCRTHASTGHRKYLDKALELCQSWLTSERESGPDGFYKGEWGAYDMAVGKRATVLAYLTSNMQQLDDYSPMDHRLLDIDAQLHMDWLATPSNISWHGNHGLFQLAGLIALGRQMPWLDGACQKANWGEGEFTRLVSEHFTDDGVHQEHSTEYQHFILGLINAVLTTGMVPLDSLLGDLFRRGLGWLEWMVHPDGRLAAFGDSVGAGKGLSWSLVEVSDVLQWFTSSGKKGRPPVEHVRVSPDGGLAVIHNADGVDRPKAASWIMMQAACHEPDPVHKHPDDGAIEWSVRGRRILVEPGKYGYLDHPMRSYVKTAAAHNTIALQDRKFVYGTDTPLPDSQLAATETEGGEFCIAARLTRGVRFKVQESLHQDRLVAGRIDSGLVVLDRIGGIERQQGVIQAFHFDPDIELKAVGIGATAQTDKCTVAVIPLSPWHTSLGLCRGQETPVLQGWHASELKMAVANSAVSIAGVVADRWFGTAILVGERDIPSLNLKVADGQVIMHSVHGRHRQRIAVFDQPKVLGVPIATGRESAMSMAAADGDWCCDVGLDLDTEVSSRVHRSRLLKLGGIEVWRNTAISAVVVVDGKRVRVPIRDGNLAFRLTWTPTDGLVVSRRQKPLGVLAVDGPLPDTLIIGDAARGRRWSGRLRYLAIRNGSPARYREDNVVLHASDLVHVCGLWNDSNLESLREQMLDSVGLSGD